MIHIAHSGWLPIDDSLPYEIRGIPLCKDLPTRREEYHWIESSIMEDAATVLDAAAGYIYEWHKMPYILSAACRRVTALDQNPRSLDMPKDPNILRMTGDITSLPFADRSFDTTCCISTLEHLSPADAAKALNELLRVTRRQLLLTADDLPGLPTAFGQPAGVDTPPAGCLSGPGVYAMDIRLY